MTRKGTKGRNTQIPAVADQGQRRQSVSGSIGRCPARPAIHSIAASVCGSAGHPSHRCISVQLGRRTIPSLRLSAARQAIRSIAGSVFVSITGSVPVSCGRRSHHRVVVDVAGPAPESHSRPTPVCCCCCSSAQPGSKYMPDTGSSLLWWCWCVGRRALNLILTTAASVMVLLVSGSGPRISSSPRSLVVSDARPARHHHHHNLTAVRQLQPPPIP